MTEPSNSNAWQSRLLPLMVGAILVSAAFFFAATLVQLYSVQNRITAPGLDFRPVLVELEANSPKLHEDPHFAQWKGVFLLESDALARRYQQGNSVILARVWTRYLGFLTGMILSFVGAAFILGKLREGGTALQAEGGGVKGSLQTSSPGIVLAVLGSVLMTVTLLVHFEVDTRDVPVYLSPQAAVTPAAQPAPVAMGPPAKWPDPPPDVLKAERPATRGAELKANANNPEASGKAQ